MTHNNTPININRSQSVDLDKITFNPPEIRDRVQTLLSFSPPELANRIEQVPKSLPNIKIGSYKFKK